MAAAERDTRKRSGDDDRASALEKEIEAQVALVAKMGDRLIEMGSSDYLKSKLAAEEKRLREMRRALAKVPRTAPPRKVPLDEVLALLERVDELALKSRARARDVLATVIEPAVMVPGPDGYELQLSLKREAAALAAGDRSGLLSTSCGGANLTPTMTPNPAFSLRPRRRAGGA